MEFQGRGAGHLNGVLWTNVSLFEKPVDEGEGPEFQTLTNAFRKMRQNENIKQEETDELARFVDKFVTCSLNPAKLESWVSDGKRLAQIAREVQQHHHTMTCRKYDTNC